jgi:hypothetical protein
MDSESKEKMQEIITNALEEFSKNYPLEYVKAVAKHQLAESETPIVPESKMRLMTREPPAVRKEGFITKQGAVRKNWKKRYFRVDGQYRVSYYKTQKEGEKPKGEFSCYGYKVGNDQTDTEEEKAGFIISLLPSDEDDRAKRVYKFKCANKDEYNEWKNMFVACCKSAECPLHPSEVRQEAFEATWLAMERGAGWGRYWNPFGSEGDMLAFHINNRIERELLQPDVFSKLKGPAFIQRKAKNTILGTVAKAVGTAVDAAWKAATAAVDAIEKPTEEKVATVTGPMGEAQQSVKDKVQSSLDEACAPILDKAFAPVREKVVPVLFKPIQKLQGSLLSFFIKGAKAKDKGESSSRDLRHEVYWSPAFDSLWDIVGKLREVLNFNIWFSDLRWKVMDDIGELMDNALYTMEKTGDFAATCGKLLHDAGVKFLEFGVWFLGELVMPLWNKLFDPVLENLVKPLADLIPDPVKEFLDPMVIVKDMGVRFIMGNVCKCIFTDEIKAEAASISSVYSENSIEYTPVGDDDADEPAAEPAAAAGKPAPMLRQESQQYVAPEERQDSDSEGEEGDDG